MILQRSFQSPPSSINSAQLESFFFTASSAIVGKPNLTASGIQTWLSEKCQELCFARAGCAVFTVAKLLKLRCSYACVCVRTVESKRASVDAMQLNSRRSVHRLASLTKSRRFRRLSGGFFWWSKRVEPRPPPLRSRRSAHSATKQTSNGVAATVLQVILCFDWKRWPILVQGIFTIAIS